MEYFAIDTAADASLSAHISLFPRPFHYLRHALAGPLYYYHYFRHAQQAIFGLRHASYTRDKKDKTLRYIND